MLHEFGTDIPEHVSVRVHDSTADCRYLVMPGRLILFARVILACVCVVGVHLLRCEEPHVLTEH